MSIFDKILGKKETTEKTEKKPEAKKEKSAEVEVEKKPAVKAEKKSEAKEEKKTVAKKAKAAKSVKPKKEVAKRKVVKKEENIAYKVLFENMISEKSTMLAAQNKYVFKVDKHAGKFQIKEAIEGYYGVQVTQVNTIRISPKKRIHGRTIGWKKGFKKAVVTLAPGNTIGAVEGV